MRRVGRSRAIKIKGIQPKPLPEKPDSRRKEKVKITTQRKDMIERQLKGIIRLVYLLLLINLATLAFIIGTILRYIMT